MIEYNDFLSALSGAREYGNYISGLCPFHSDNTPSLLIFPDGWFRCLACNRHGNWKTLWNKLKGQSVVVRQEVNTKWKGPGVHPNDAEEICWQSHMDLMNFSSFRWYLEMRGVSEMIEPCELGYYNGWYTIPVRDEAGHFQTAVYRAAPHVQGATGLRYWSQGAPQIYVPDWHLFNSRKYMVVVFGMIDAIALAYMRQPVCTVTSGKDLFNAEWLERYKKSIYVIPDKGEYASAMKLTKELDWRGNIIYLDYPDGMKDPADFASQGKLPELELILNNTIKEAYDT